MRWPLLGDIPDLFKDVPGTFARLYKTYGDRAPFLMGTNRGMLLSSPEDAKLVLMAPDTKVQKSRYTKMMGVVFGESVLIAEGEKWAAQRAYLNPLFTPKAIMRHIPVIIDETHELCRSFSAEAPPIFNANEQSRLLIQRIMGRILFGDLFPRDKLDALMRDLQTVNECLFGEFIRKSILRGPLSILPSRNRRKFEAAISSISRFIDELIESGVSDDNQSLAAEIIRAAPVGEDRRREIKDQITVLFYAGQDTTARALAWILYFLCEHPEWVEKIRKEATKARLESGSTVDLKALGATLCVVKETLRLRPVAYAIDRQVLSSDVLPSDAAPPDTITPISVTNIHRHPAYWDHSGEFDPSRFSSEGAAGRHPCAFIPFGHGRRKCVGSSLAELELTLVVAIISAHFDLSRADAVPIRAKAAVTLAPDPEFRVILTRPYRD